MSHSYLFKVKIFKTINDSLILIIVLIPVANFGNTPLVSIVATYFSITKIELILKQILCDELFILITDVPQKQLITDDGQFCRAAFDYMLESYVKGIDTNGHDNLFMRAMDNIVRK